MTSFVGRDNELADIAPLLGTHRLVTVTGPGGVGKTRLAVEIGARVWESFAGGVWLADLSAAEPSARVSGLVANALGVQPEGRDPLKAIVDHLGQQRVLLILDTCEHVADQVRSMAETLLRAVPNLVILATSRVALDVDYEAVRTLAPLPLVAAERLFMERFGRSGSEEPDATVRQICTKLDGLPLALELAAARSRSASPEAVLGMLEDPKNFMRLRHRRGIQRHESLDSVVDWSFRLLTPAEQVTFLRLGVFASSFSERGGASAATDDTYGSREVAEAIWSLADYSLLERVMDASETRYRMLETLRAYARQHLKVSEAIASSRRLATALLELVGPWIPSNAECVAERRLEIDNIRGVIPLLNDAEPELVQLLAVTVLGAADASADYVSYQREADAFVSDLADPTPTRALLLAWTAHLHHRVGDFSTDELLREAEDLVAAVGPEPDWSSGMVGTTRADWFEATGRPDEAIVMAREALERDLPNRGRRVWLDLLGILLIPDAPDSAVKVLEEGLALVPSDHRFRMAAFHSNIAEGLMRLGRYTEAAEHQLQALRVGTQLGIPMLVALSLIVAARLSALSTRWPTAVRLYAAADGIIAQSGTTLHPDDVELCNQMLNDARCQFPDTYDTLWNDGYRMDIAEAAEEGIATLIRESS